MVNLDTAKFAMCDSYNKSPSSWHYSVVENCMDEIKRRFIVNNLTHLEAYQKLESKKRFSYYWIPQHNGFDCGVYVCLVSNSVNIFFRFYVCVFLRCSLLNGSCLT